MATHQASSFFCPSFSCSSSSRKEITRAAIKISKLTLNSSYSLPNVYTNTNTTHIEKHSPLISANVSDPIVIAKLYAIMEAVSDRVEMHKNIGEQRNNWNSLLLTSINSITLGAATVAGMAAATSAVGAPLLALKLSSTLMYLAATGMLILMNKIQPSQLAEEQRNATRLFKQLRSSFETTIAIGNPTDTDVNEAMEKVLAIDRAFPLPLLGVMLEKFPSAVEPAMWWPQQRKKNLHAKKLGSENGNGWNGKLEEEMREIVGVLGKNDKADYLRLGGKALKINKVLAICGPFLTGLAAIGSAFVGFSSWAAVVGVAAGALASVVNTMEHGGQVGMVVELYRSNAGFFKEMEETIESNLKERDVERRENGELFEMKVALNLGRSLSELRDLAANSSARKGKEFEEFGSKLF